VRLRQSIRSTIRTTPPLARLLTEYRVRSLGSAAEQPEFAATVNAALPGTTAIDVGASVGNYALALMKKVGRGGRVIALEANPDVFAELRASTWPSSHLTAINAAASDRSGTATFHVPRRSGSVSHPLGSLEDRTGDSVSTVVPTLTLDELSVQGRVSLIKVDVEGHEGKVLAGASNLLREHRPTLVVEIEERHLAGTTSVADVVNPVLELGYTASGIGTAGLIPWDQFDVSRHQLQLLDLDNNVQPGGQGEYVNNFLLVPADRASR